MIRNKQKYRPAVEIDLRLNEAQAEAIGFAIATAYVQIQADKDEARKNPAWFAIIRQKQIALEQVEVMIAAALREKGINQ